MHCMTYSHRKEDVGKAKADVAAAFVNKRVKGCKVTPYCNRIEDFDESFYRRESFPAANLPEF